jgi:T-complex protein 1 subunit theta
MTLVGGTPALLKEGTKLFSGVEETIIKNVDACQQLSQKSRTSLGPNGMKKLIINHLDKLFVTSDAATIIKELEVVHPAARMLVMASQMQEQEVGDGTNLVIVLGGEFLIQAEALIRMGLHPNEIITGYTKAGKKVLELLEGLATVKCQNISDVNEVSKYLKIAIASKQYGWEDLLAPLVAGACVQILPKVPKNFNVDNVRVAKILGGGVTDTKLVRGFVTTRDSEGTVKHVKNAKIGIFVQGIDIAKPETKPTVLISTAEELMNYNKSEEKLTEEHINSIAQSGVNVIVSGGPIGEMALHFIERHKIMVVKLNSKFEIRRLCKATGAVPLIRVGSPTAEEIGHCDSVSVDEIGGNKVCVFCNEAEDSKLSTIIVRASTQNILDDLERCIDDAVNVFKGLIRDPRVVPGAGATEIELARLLETFGDSAVGLDQYAIKKFGEAFEVIPRTLAENAGASSIEAISSLYAAHQAGKTDVGVDIEEGSVRSATEAGIYDLYLAKHWAIKLATDAALTILRVDQIIMSKPAGGPKVPKQGTRDSEEGENL